MAPKKIAQLFKNIAVVGTHGCFDAYPSGLSMDSRTVQQGDLFVAVKGTHLDGHRFIEKAIKCGATMVVCERLPNNLSDKVAYWAVEDSRKVLAQLAGNFYGHPSKSLKLIGVTGTNGKTTITNLLYDLFQMMGMDVGLISTVVIRMGRQSIKSTHTTPDVISNQCYLRQMVDAGITHCFMEVSSHGIDQGRIEGLHFAGGVFTNLTQDHLDYHKDFITYRNVKKSFFDGLPPTAFALTNHDDKNGMVMLQNTKAEKMTYGLKKPSDFKAKRIDQDFHGMQLQIAGKEAFFRLIGMFNAYNLLAVYGVGIALGLDSDALLVKMSTLHSVEGRFDHFVSENGVMGIVDFAHTPDALEQLLKTLRGLAKSASKIYTVVGCGGDRDTEKRPLMGGIASRYSDVAVFTADNPRSEHSEHIIKQMQAGVTKEHEEKVLCIADRAQALKVACKMADKGDIVIAAGKGHENHQIIGKERLVFSDKAYLKRFLKIAD